MINAKEELLEALQRSGKSIEDIEFAGVYYDCLNYDIRYKKVQSTFLITHIDMSNKESRGESGARCATEDTDFLLDFLNFSYDEGFGMQYIYGYILFSDGSWLERREYDGAEWWKFMTLPTKESIEDYINSRESSRDII